MGLIIGTFVQIITYPGVIMQLVALRLFCDLMHVEVYEADYWSGKLIYGEIRGLGRAFVISLAPLFINTSLCMILTFPYAFSKLNNSAAADSLAGTITTYLGVCMGMHAIPTKKMMNEFAEKVEFESAGFITRALFKLVSMLFGIFDVLRFIWADAVYTLVISMALPLLAFWYVNS